MDNNNVGLLGEEETSRQGEVAQKQEVKTVVSNPDTSATHSEDPAPPEEFDDKLYQRVDWEKRYGDMRRYHDKIVGEKDNEIQSLLEQVNHGKEWTVPHSSEDLEKIRESDTKLYEAIQEGAKLHYNEGVENLKRDNLKLRKEAEMAKLKFKHPDVDQIKESKEFKDWVKEQPDEIKDWLYKKIDSTLAAKAIDMFKKEIIMNTSDNTQTKGDESAADQVRTKQTVQQESNDEHIFTQKEINRMPLDIYEKYRAVIDSQQRRGLIK